MKHIKSTCKSKVNIIILIQLCIFQRVLLREINLLNNHFGILYYYCFNQFCEPAKHQVLFQPDLYYK
jgi:hypothetical protein